MSKILMDSRFMRDQKKVEHVLEKIKKIDVCTFSTMDALGSRRLLGVSGQSVAKVFPEAVEVDGMGHHRVDLEALVPVLLLAIQELTKEEKKAEKKAEAKVEEKPATKADKE